MSWDMIDEKHDASVEVARPAFRNLPDGKYEFCVTKFQRHSTKKGEPKYFLEAITRYQFEGDAEPIDMTIKDYLDPRKDNAWYWKTNQFLRSLGASGEVALIANEEGVYESVIGLTFNAEIKNFPTKDDKGNEYTNTRVQKYSPMEAVG